LKANLVEWKEAHKRQRLASCLDAEESDKENILRDVKSVSGSGEKIYSGSSSGLLNSDSDTSSLISLSKLKTENDFKSKVLMFSNIYRVFVACGMLILPHAISLSGVVPSLVLIIVMLFLTNINHNYMHRISEDLQLKRRVTLETLTDMLLGNKMRLIVLTIISGSQISAFIGSFILSTELIHHSFCMNTPESEDCISRLFVSGVLATFNIFMVLIPNLKTFAYISSFSVFFQFFALLTVFYNATQMFLNQKNPSDKFITESVSMNWSSTVQTLGVFLYIFQRLTFYLPIRSNYVKMKNFHKIYMTILNLVFFYAFLVSLPCFYQFFKDGKEIIFQNFDHSYKTVHVFKYAYVIVIFVSNPINLFPIYNSIYNFRAFKRYCRRNSSLWVYLAKLAVRFAISFVAILVGMYVDSFVSFCSFVGGFFFSFLGLILPGLLFLYHERKIKGAEKAKVYFVLGLGVCVFWVASFQSLKDLVENTSSAI
jgi:amino acid permease